MPRFLADLRHSWRRTLQRPGATLSIIALLALGTGGVTAVFNPIYSTLFAPIPFPQPEQLVRIGSVGGNIPLINDRTGGFYEEETLSRVFSDLAAYLPDDSNIPYRMPDTDKLIYPNRLEVTENFFETLGVKPIAGSSCVGKAGGRPAPGVEQNWVVSHRFWRNELNQKPDAIGSHLADKTIVGIMPEGFNFPFDVDIWMCRGVNWNYVPSNHSTTQYIGRLRPGISAVQAAEILQPSVPSIRSSHGWDAHTNVRIRLESLQTYLYGDQRPLLKMFGAAAILFLLLVCTGVINLLIAQGLKRKQEIATRLIFGATRGNLIFQLLRETLPLIAVGGLTGLWLSEIASAWIWTQSPALRGGAVDVPVKMAFWAALMLVVTLIGGLIPAFYATGLDLNTWLKSASSGGRRLFSTQEFLVGVQLSLALALLIGMGLVIRGMMFNIDIPAGWQSRDIAMVSVLHGGSGIGIQREATSFAILNEEIMRELNAMPEVLTSGVLHPVPFSKQAFRLNTAAGMNVSKTKPAAFTGPSEIDPLVTINYVMSDGFAVLGIPLIAGRHLTEADSGAWTLPNAERVPAIINQALAQYMWPEENPLGKMLYDVNTMNGASYEIVGVVRNYHQIPGNRDFVPAIYFHGYGSSSVAPSFLVKLRQGASFQSFNSNARLKLSGGFALSWIDVRPMSTLVRDATANQRLAIQLLSCFAVLGVFVSGLAVYATATLAAAARTRETGIRMAIGAQVRDILRLAFWRGFRAILLGLPFGLFMAWILSRILSVYLVQVNVGDPLIWVISCAILLVITTIAALIPALRAVRVNPLDALRNE